MTVEAELLEGFKRPSALPRGTVDHIAKTLFPDPPEHEDDPVGWVEDHGEYIWSKQRETLESVLENRYTAVVACHGPGKTRVGSRAAGWWIDTFRHDAFVLWLAPKWAQVTSVMGRELRQMHGDMKLPGRITLDQQWYIGDDRLVGVGRSPADHDQHGLQGYHARKVLIVVDEADGISPSMWKAIFSLMTNPEARCLMLGNPDDPSSEWREHVEGGQCNVIHIPVEATPNFTGEDVPAWLAEILPSQQWVKEQIDRYGPDSPVIQSKVHARWPKSHERAVYPVELIKEALVDEVGPDTCAAQGRGSVLAVDVAREGRDRSIGLVLHPTGIPSIAIDLPQNDTTQLTGEVVAWHNKNPRAKIVVDANGVGAGVFDNCREQGLPVRAHYGSAAPRDKKVYLNARAEAYFETQRALAKDKLYVPRELGRLRKQMSQILFEYAGKGQLKIESKESMAARGVPSPDELDALVMAVYAKRLGRLKLAHAGLQEANVAVGGTYAT